MNLFSILLAVSLLANPTKNTPPTRNTLTLTFVGDVLLDRGVRQHVEHTAAQLGIKDIAQAANLLFTHEVDKIFQQSDCVIANLECPATDIKSPIQKRFSFRADPSWLPILRKHGITHCNLANNHSIDQGRKGLISTLENLKAANITPIGAGKTMDEASRPVLLYNHPRKVYLLVSAQMVLENYPFLPQKPCVSQQNIQNLCTTIRKIKDNEPNSIVLVSLHWGTEHTPRPVPQQRMQARQLIDNGADALICHHTHTLQTIEKYHNKYIFYSIGNFIFDQHKPINTKTVIVQFQITSTNLNCKTITCEIKNCVPHITH